jgi:MFS family permease
LLGGMLVELWGWPAVFWFRAPIALTALVFLRGVPSTSRRGAREPVDIVGAGLLAFGIVTLLLMLNQLQQLDRHNFLTFGLFGAALASLLGFLGWERRAALPIVNLALFRIGGFAAINLASVLIYLTGFAVLLFVPYYFVRFTGLSLPMAGAMLAASFGGTIAASPLAGWMVRRLAAERLAALGAVLCGGGLFLIGGWEAGAPALVLLAALVLQGFGVGFFQVAYLDVVMGTLPPQHRGVAGSLAMLTRTLGVVTGATLLTLLFHFVEVDALSRGQTAAESFLSAFRASFRIAGVVCALTGILVPLAKRIRT